ncbi:MAG: ComEA family DNA-binding protein [Christensenellales bacterium]|jgi:endonuclease III-like uncharacterized protein
MRKAAAALCMLSVLCLLLFSVVEQKGQTISPKERSVVLPDFKADLVERLNHMTKEDYMQVPGIGNKTADSIIQAIRSQPLYFVEDLRTLHGIGEKRLEAILQFIR